MKHFLNTQNKYRAQKTEIDGIVFDSKAEAQYYRHLKQYETLGLLKIILLQPKVYLTKSKLLYRPDFLIHCNETSREIYIDVKGKETPVFNIKARLWEHYGAGLLQIVKKRGNGFYIEKEIETKSK